MRNKIVATIFLVASIILVIKSLNPLKIYNFVEKGNSFIKEEKYSNGREEYEKALKLRENNQVKLNILKSFYSEKNYEEVTKSDVEEGFLKGNSYVYLGDNSQDKNKEFYEKALEEYKLAMKTSDDINIKKNYELTLKKVEDMSKQQNQDNQQNNSQENSEQNQNSKDNNDSQNQEDKSSQSNEENQSSNNKEQEKKESSSQENQNNEKEQESNSQQNEQNNKQNEDNTQENENQNESSDKKENNQNSNTAPQNMKEPSQEEIREQEVRAILKRLEGNEKQSFKNNERVMDINSNNPSNRW